MECLIALKRMTTTFTGAVNLDNPSGFGGFELVETIQALVECKSGLVHKQSPAFNTKQHHSDIQLAKGMIWRMSIAPPGQGLKPAPANDEHLLSSER